MGLKYHVLAAGHDEAYWNNHKKAILKQADKHGKLNKERVHPNARARRYASRHPQKARIRGPRDSSSWRDWYNFLLGWIIGKETK